MGFGLEGFARQRLFKSSEASAVWSHQLRELSQNVPLQQAELAPPLPVHGGGAAGERLDHLQREAGCLESAAHLAEVNR